jgi:hypothetical protein
VAVTFVTSGGLGRLIVQFPYAPERVAADKSVPERWGYPKARYSMFSHTTDIVEQIHASFLGDYFTVFIGCPSIAHGFFSEEGWGCGKSHERSAN